MRASLVAEAAGIPSVSIVSEGFARQAQFTAAGSGVPDLPVALYPGRMSFDTVQQLDEKVRETTLSDVVEGLTVQPREPKRVPEPGPDDIVFTGTFEQVNEYFYSQEWSDGLPVVPPTKEKVQEFLKFTSRAPEEVVGILLPDKREATVWNIAVNGVMAGCRPEYMPVLVALVEAMADPQFGQEHLGHTPGTETLIILNGPVIKDLGFNFEQGALRVGYQANTSVGRFWRLYLRNVAGFLLNKTDKGTFGGTWRVILAENEDAVAGIGWKPMSVDQGFREGENVITITSCTSTDSTHTVGAVDIQDTLKKICARIVDTQLWLFGLSQLGGNSIRPLVLLSPITAEALAGAGYSKADVKRYLYEHARFTARRYEELSSGATLQDSVQNRRLPKQFAESEDPERLVPLVWSPDDFIIVVAGDPMRDNCYMGAQNGFIGYPTSKKINLPPNWKDALEESRPG